MRALSMGAEGDGVVMGEDGARRYVAGLLPGETGRVAGAGERPRLIDVVEASSARRDPPCPHFGACGGCAFQHWAEAPVQAFKTDLLRTTLARAGHAPPFLESFVAGPGERRRVALHARRSGGARPLLGFKGRRDWGVVSLKTCLVADPLIVAALPGLADLSRGLLDSSRSAPTLLVTRTLDGLAVDVTGVEGGARDVDGDRRAGLAAEAASLGLARLTLGGETLFESTPPHVRHGRVTAPFPTGGFLQAVARAETHMARLAADALRGCDRVADLFCGSGAFALVLAERSGVRAVDASAGAVGALRHAAAGAAGLKAIACEVRDLHRRPLSARELAGVQGVVIDPPRAGAFDQVRELAQSDVEALVYVSCNPATFARDAAVLVDGGFSLQRVAPVDQFLWSPHIELVGFFERRRP